MRVRSGSDGVGRIRAILGRVAPHARIDEQSAWLQPLSGLLDTLRLLGVGIVLLVALAMVGTVVLVTRAALNTHRETIEVLHMMGATDGQISRLFERRSTFARAEDHRLGKEYVSTCRSRCETDPLKK